MLTIENLKNIGNYQNDTENPIKKLKFCDTKLPTRDNALTMLYIFLVFVCV